MATKTLRPFFAALMVLILLPSAHAQSLQRHLIDSDWKFNLGDATGAEVSGFNDSSWRNVDLPHDWSIEGKIAAKNPTGGGGGFFPAGVGWYRKIISAPAEWTGKRVLVEFEGVYMNSDVYLNGEKLGNHPYGYTSFYYDLTSHLKMGAENILAIRVDNSEQKNSRFYSGSGIYRHVWLSVEDTVHVAPWGTEISTPTVSAATAQTVVKNTVRNDSNADIKATIVTQIYSPENQKVSEANADVTIAANGEQTVSQEFQITKPALWSPDSPKLYRAVSVIHRAGGADGSYQTTFGIRAIKVLVDKGFELNGQTIKLFGACVHHDNGCLGAAAFDHAEERRVQLLKDAGFNAIRTSHNPPSPAFLDACDRLGMLVMDEAFDCWENGKNAQDYHIYFKDWWQRDVDSMVLRDRNHASVVMWSIGNEIPDAGLPSGIQDGGMLADHIRTLDKSRPITQAVFWYNGMNGNGQRWTWTDADPLFAKLDISGYNYQLGSFVRDHNRVPDRVMLSTESRVREAFPTWQLADQLSYDLGDFVWTGMDYLGESGIGKYVYPPTRRLGHGEDSEFPNHGAYCGDIDLTGFRKPVSHYRNIVWNRGEKLYTSILEPTPDGRLYSVEGWGIAPAWASWSWPGFEGKNLQVEVDSRYESVRLSINGTLLGEKPTTEKEQFKAVFTVPYAAGELKTEGIQDGKIVDQNILKTVGPAATIRLTPDRKSISADGEDVSFVTVEALDKDGNFQPNGDQQITFALTGPGIIACVGSGDVTDEQPYQGNTRKLFHGRAQLVARSGHDKGTVAVKATGSGLTDGSTEIEIK